MLTGNKGVKYGLQPGARPKAKPVLQKALNIFGDDDDDGDGGGTTNVGREVARQAAKKQADKKVTQMHAAALAEDASVFDYDGVYDSIQEGRVQPKQQEKLARKSRYIEGLLDKAKERQREQDIIYERTLLKERAAEDHLFGDKDKFVTAAYKAKLEEDQKWLAAERIREARDAKSDALKAGHMGNFYRNVMTNNVAFGTAEPTKAPPPRPAAPAAEPAAPAAPVDPDFEAARRAREAYEAARQQSDGGAAGGRPAAAEAPGRVARGASPQEMSKGRSEAGSGAEAGAKSMERHSVTAAAMDQRDAEAKEVSGAREAGTRDGQKARDAASGDGKRSEEAAAPGTAAAGKPQEEDKAAKAAAARERFLARKRKAPDAS